MRIILWLATLAAFAPAANANICGTDYQNFNPTTGGLDFVTVHSSETLRPCIINMGLFFNYAKNNVTYSQVLNPAFAKGQQRSDKVLGADLSLGMGLTDKWDFGVNVPFVVEPWLDDDIYLSSFDQNGATEIKANTKYQFSGNENGGFAGVFSINKNLIRNNPFAGESPGLTFNYELVWDTIINEKWAVAVNAGYRDRGPDEPIPGVPFAPLDDQWIFSGAGSYLLPKYDTKVIFEIYGSRAAKSGDPATEKNLNNLEGLIGFKHDYSENMAIHFGGATQIDAGVSGPDWRVYAGINWTIGPVCRTDVVQAIKGKFESGPEVFTVDLHLLFALNSDQILPDRLVKFDETYKRIAAGGFERMAIEGHTDSVGEAAYNLDLSQRRANFVRNHLIKHHGVAPAKITATGYGEEKPIADNGNYQGRQKNRRVEFKFWR